jgi:hypothetical protein
LNKSSNAFFALDGLEGDEEDFVSRSTVVRGSKNVHSLRASLGDTRDGIGFWHSNAALVSKCAHWAHVWRSAWQREQVPTGLHAAAMVSSFPQRAHFTTSRKPGMLKVFGCTGGWPRGAYSFFGAWGPRSRGSAGWS